jgi:hypothetical protein
MSRPSALAVLRLTTNSYFEACSTELAHRPARADKARPRALSRVSRVSAECAAPPRGPPSDYKSSIPGTGPASPPIKSVFPPPGTRLDEPKVCGPNNSASKPRVMDNSFHSAFPVNHSVNSRFLVRKWRVIRPE